MIVKVFEILPKHNGYVFISKTFALMWYIFGALRNKKLLLFLQHRIETNLIPDCKINKILAPVLNVVSSNACVFTKNENIFTILIMHR